MWQDLKSQNNATAKNKNNNQNKEKAYQDTRSEITTFNQETKN